jgi:hypothetical protein
MALLHRETRTATAAVAAAVTVPISRMQHYDCAIPRITLFLCPNRTTTLPWLLLLLLQLKLWTARTISCLKAVFVACCRSKYLHTWIVLLLQLMTPTICSRWQSRKGCT